MRRLNPTDRRVVKALRDLSEISLTDLAQIAAHKNHEPSIGSAREAIKRLRAKGFKIQSVRGIGYRLTGAICTNCRMAPAVRATRNIQAPKLPMCVACSRAYCAGYVVASKRLARRGPVAVQEVSAVERALRYSRARGYQAAVPEPPVGHGQI